jgi:hypothetical protein
MIIDTLGNTCVHSSAILIYNRDIFLVFMIRNIASVCIKPDLFQWTFINMCNKVCHTVGENALTVNGSLIFKRYIQYIYIFNATKCIVYISSDKKVRIILFILDFKIGNGRQSKRLLDNMGWIFLFLCFFC